jgi:MFS family permease
MLSEGHYYAVLILARVLQGVGSAMVWVVGLALLYVLCIAASYPPSDSSLRSADVTLAQKRSLEVRTPLS